MVQYSGVCKLLLLKIVSVGVPISGVDYRFVLQNHFAKMCVKKAVEVPTLILFVGGYKSQDLNILLKHVYKHYLLKRFW